MDSTVTPFSAERLLDLDVLSQTALARFRTTGDPFDIDEAISAQKQSIAHTAKSDTKQLVTRLRALATACSIRFSASKHILDIRQSVSCLQTAQTICDPGLSNAIAGELAEALTEFGICLIQRARLQGKAGDLGQAVDVLKRAVDNPGSGDPAAVSRRLGALGVALKRRFQRNQDPEDIHQSVRVLRQDCNLKDRSNETITNRAVGYYNLAASLSERYQTLGDPQDLLEAVEFFRTTVKIAPSTDPNRSTYLLELGGNLNLLFEATGDCGAVSESITVLLEALSLSDENKDVNHASTLVTLGEAYQLRFERCGGSSDEITASIYHIRRALELTPPADPRRMRRLASLSSALRARFQRHGDLACLQEAVVCTQEAIQIAPAGHPVLASLHNTLGVTLGERYQHTKELADLQGAILSSRQAVILTAENNPLFSSYLYNLASSLDVRSGISGHGEDVQEAAIAYQKVLSMTPPSHPDYALYQGKVATSLSAVFELGRNMLHLEQSIQLYQSTIRLMDDQDHRKRTTIYGYIGALNLRYRELGIAADLDEVIASLQQVVPFLQETNPDAVECYCRLADAFRRRFEAQGCIEDLQGAVTHFRSAALSPGGNPTRRLLAARLWVRYTEKIEPRSVLDAHEAAVSIVSLLVGLDRRVEERHSKLARSSAHGVVRAAFAAALKHGETEKALEWLEQGRCLVWRQIHDLKTPVENLELEHAELARRFSSLSAQLEELHVDGSHTRSEVLDSTAVMEQFGTSSQFVEESELHRRTKLVQDWEDILRTVREKDGFEAFLRPVPISDTLGRLPRDGYTIVLNADATRCDAIVIPPSAGGPQPIRLSEFSEWKGEMMFQRLQAFLRKSGAREAIYSPDGKQNDSTEAEPDGASRAVTRFRPKSDKDNIEWVLKELWEYVVKPIVAHLQLKPSSNPADRTRIWWCVTGPLAFLPIHAAGIYKDEESTKLGETLADYAISSYTPNLAALAQRTRGPPQRTVLQPGGRSLLIINHSDAPGLNSIPGTRSEARAIQSVAEESISGSTLVVHLENGSATVESVKGQISSSKFDVVHFACHANQDFKTPMRSGFHLEDGKLSLGDITGRRGGQTAGGDTPKLAFLSACETGTGKMELSEEAVHLAAGMLAAGYRGVIGTIWSIPDAYAPEIAEGFYKEYLGTEGGDAGYALHCATERLRKRLGNSNASFLAWVPFVHFGL